MKAANITLNRYDVPAAEVARWNKVAGEPLWEEWVKKMEGKGHKEARDILKSALEFAKNDQVMISDELMQSCAVIPGRERSSRARNPEQRPKRGSGFRVRRCTAPRNDRSFGGIRLMKSLERLLHRFELALLYVGVLATFAMMCLTSADALSRYAAQQPDPGRATRSPKNT